jgi:hypothetical protein
MTDQATITDTNDIEARLATILNDLIDEREICDPDPALEEIAECVEGMERVSTFSDEGILTTDAGLVLRMGDGTEFQITIVRSK